MPVQTGFGAMSLGRDVSADVVLPDGRHLLISNITSFDAKPKTKKLSSMGIDGMHRYAVVPESWTITFEVDRVDPTVDDFFAAVEEGYFNGANLQNCIVNQIIDEADGSISTYRYEGVALSYDDAGNWKADAFVKQRLSGEASRRRKVT